MQKPKSITGLPYFFSDAFRVSIFLTAAFSGMMDAVGIGGIVPPTAAPCGTGAVSVGQFNGADGVTGVEVN